MPAFTTIPNAASQGFQLLYRRDEYSFGVVSRLEGHGVSIVLNTVQLWFADDGRILYVDGYCPYQGWQHTALPPPAYSSAALVLVSPTPESIQSGTAISLNTLEDQWPVHVNPADWVCIGEPADHGDQATEFAPSSVAVLKGDSLVALWLHPTIV